MEVQVKTEITSYDLQRLRKGLSVATGFYRRLKKREGGAKSSPFVRAVPGERGEEGPETSRGGVS